MLNPYLASLVDDGLSPAYILKRIHQVHPTITYSKGRAYIPLSAEVKEERVKLATRLLRRTPKDFFENCVFIDETSIHSFPATEGVWHERGTVTRVPEPRLSANSKLHGEIHLLLAVHPKEGVLYTRICSKTPGSPDKGKFKASLQYLLFYTLQNR